MKKRFVLPALCLFFLSALFPSAEGKELYIKQGNGEIHKIESSTIYIRSTNKELKEESLDKIEVKGSSSDDNETITIINGLITAKSGVTVRSGPSTSYTSLGALKYAEKIEIVDSSGSWYKIKFGSSFGYVTRDYVSIDGTLPEEDEPIKPNTIIKTIVIDPGHGGSEPGATNILNGTRIYEKDIVLDISLRIKKKLEAKGIKVIMTRTSDVYVDLYYRPVISNSSGADFFLSVHNNSFTTEVPNGIETYALNTTGFAANVAKKIQSDLVSATGLFSRGFKTNNFVVLRNNNIPAALVEIGFLSNPNERALLMQNSFRELAATSITNSILSFK